jgi:hypothetical protein
VDHLLLKNKTSTPITNDADEKVKLQFELSLVARVKYEEEEKKKKQEQDDESKFDYMTLLINSTKKHGSLRKGGPSNGGAITYKHSMTKKGIGAIGK